ncbi:MAG: hypothetical protein ACLPWS_22885 [Rhodomicrobium sp.]
MKNITLAVEDDVLAAVRKLAAERETTVNGLVRDYLKSLAKQASKDDAARARQELVKLSETTTGRLPDDWKWNREDLYDRPSLLRHERAGVCGDGKKGGGGQEGSGR